MELTPDPALSKRDAMPADMPSAPIPAAPVQLIDMVFPGDTNHHGTLFGGGALAHMDKAAFLTAARHGRAPFVTAATEQIDFAAPARMGDMVEVTGRIVKVGNSSILVQVDLVAETPDTGERRLCTRGIFVLVAIKGPQTRLPLPPLEPHAAPEPEPGRFCLADLILPPQTNHYGTLYGGDALKMMGKAAFIAASRHARRMMVMQRAGDIDFLAPVHSGDMVECVTGIVSQDAHRVEVSVELWAEGLLSGARRIACTGRFVLAVAAGDGRPQSVEGHLAD